MPRLNLRTACTACTALLLLGRAASAHAGEPPDPAAAAAPSPAAIPLEQRVRELEEALRQVRAALPPPPPPPAAPGPPDPFAYGDFSWMNGNSRQTERLLDTKYFTPQLDIDVNYTYSFNHPIDNTVVGSTALARNNEMELSFLGLGGDAHIGNVRGRLMLQFGTRSTIVPRNDLSTLRGQFDLQTAYRYISEGYVGYHFDVLRGLNVDLGIFMSYVGLFSYDNFENWAYQPSYTSDNTPWFFNGARIQLFPTDRLKLEVWIINGWQTYAKFNDLPGVGYQVKYAPREWVSLVSNGYVGTDTQDHPGRVRFHSDTSLLFRYVHRPDRNSLSQAGLSFTIDWGFEQGDGVQAFGGSGKEGGCTRTTPCEQDFLSAMVYNRLWFWKNQIGWTFGGGFIHNPGRYLVLVPTGLAAQTFDTNPGTQFDGWDVSTTVDWMPSQNITLRLEGVHREASVNYFAGPGGVTGPDGYKTGGLYHPDGTISTSVPPGWTPDLVKAESRIILALICRI